MKLFDDGVPNCENGDDELNLFCFENGKKMNGSHYKNFCFRPICTCTEVYYHNTVGGCSPYSLKRVMCNIMFFDEVKKIKSTNLKKINIYNLMLSGSKINIEPKDIILGNTLIFNTDCTKE